ncbi:MAG: hypothetical protein WDN10_00440 [bacterium]
MPIIDTGADFKTNVREYGIMIAALRNNCPQVSPARGDTRHHRLLQRSVYVEGLLCSLHFCRCAAAVRKISSDRMYVQLMCPRGAVRKQAAFMAGGIFDGDDYRGMYIIPVRDLGARTHVWVSADPEVGISLTKRSLDLRRYFNNFALLAPPRIPLAAE